jgi:hypothetical protein
MIRAIFIGVAVVLMANGIILLGVESVEPSAKVRNSSAGYALWGSEAPDEIEVPEWFPWSLISPSIVMLSYAFIITGKPKKAEGGH